MWRLTLIALSLTAHALCQEVDPGRALREGHQLTAAQAASAEAVLRTEPEDWQNRVRLLGYYANRAKISGTGESSDAARLEQILWLIEHHPEFTVLRASDAAIPFRSGDGSVTGGLEQVKQAWGQAVATHATDARVLTNAAWFFRLLDKDQSVELLRRAILANPADQMLRNQLGAEYALILLGARAIDPSGRMAGFDAVEANSPLAQTVRRELSRSSEAAVMYVAGSTLMEYRVEAMRSGIVEDPGAFGTSLIERAKTLNPSLVPARIRVGGNVQAANLVTKVTPVYPALAKQARIQGLVRFSAIIAKNGEVSSLQLISGHPLLVPPAQDAVKQWVYKSTLLNGMPVEVVTQIDVNFTLSEPQPAAESDILK